MEDEGEFAGVCDEEDGEGLAKFCSEEVYKDVHRGLNTLSMVHETATFRIYLMAHFSAAISDEHIEQIRSVITGQIS